MSELEKLLESERQEFLRILHTAPHERSPEDRERFSEFDSKIDLRQYQFEIEREEAAKPMKRYCQIIGRSPYLLWTSYGDLELPSALVPEELTKLPEEQFDPDWFTAVISIDLDTEKITSLRFIEYHKKDL